MESVLRRKPQDTSREHIHLSPRMWGTSVAPAAVSAVLRFIPTNVGNMVSGISMFTTISVHPHECGEHRTPAGTS